MRTKRTLIPLITIVLLLGIWHGSVTMGLLPNFLVPTPLQVVQALIQDSALIGQHTLVTLYEALVGLAAGSILGVIVALSMDKYELFYHAFSPLMTISQTIPTVAIAPMLVLWLGYGVLPKMVLVILTTFFPVAVALLEGLRSVPQARLDVVRQMGASQLQVFWYAKLPAALGHLFSGLTIAVTYAVVAAVVAEWLGGDMGLGVYMTRVRKSFSYDRMFASIVVISALSLVLMRLMQVLQRICMPWTGVTQHDA